MNNYKIKVNNEAESKEAQELFFELGYGWHGRGKEVSYLNEIGETFTHLVARQTGGYKKPVIQMGCGKEDCKEITLQQLRALVLEQKMASHNIEQQELQANPKLFLDPAQNYAEIEWDCTFFKPDYLIEVPNGAVEARINGSGGINFINANDDYMNDATGGEWVGTHRGKHDIAGHTIVWQRAQDEPFLTPESVVNVMESLASSGISLAPRNSAESISIQSKIKSELELEPQGIDATLAERQSTYGDFIHVANTTGKLFAEIKNGKNAHMLPYVHEEALHMICSKIARIVNGDCNHKDSWHDIAGYAKLIENLIKE